jgi:hypothetical protein
LEQLRWRSPPLIITECGRDAVEGGRGGLAPGASRAEAIAHSQECCQAIDGPDRWRIAE